jgi:hypothetical protein
MMFGRGADSVDRTIITTKVRGLIGRGPGGWWRLLKNAARFGLRLGEKPLPTAKWEALVRQAGFGDVRTARVVAEACVLSATKPAMSDSHGQPPSRHHAHGEGLTGVQVAADRRPHDG